MSLSLSKKERKQEAATPKTSSLDFSRLPQVNLLPSEILEKRSLRELQGRIGVAFLILLGVLVLGYGGVQFEKSLADSRYDRALEETTRLKAEEAKYAEVPRILGQIKDSQAALRDGMYREILWKDYLGALVGTVPDDGLIKSLEVQAATPNDKGPTVADGLQGQGIGQLTFSVNLEKMPDTVAWLNELNAIPGFAEARLDSAVLASDTKGKEAYEFTGTVQLLESIYSHRFEPETKEEAKNDANDS